MEDWRKQIVLADEHEKPLIAFIPNGPKPVARTRNYQADVYEAPAQTNIPDGKDNESYKNAGQLRVELIARIEPFDTTASVSLIADEFGNAAGVDDELAREIDKQTEILQRNIECKLGSDDPAVIDNGAVQDRTQAIGVWIQSTTSGWAHLPNPTANGAAILPPAASIYAGVKASFDEPSMQALLQSSWAQTGDTGDQFFVVGPELKKRINAFHLYVPGSLSTQSTTLMTNRQMTDKRITRVTDRYDSEFGNYEVHLSKWLANPGWAAPPARPAGVVTACTPRAGRWIGTRDPRGR